MANINFLLIISIQIIKQKNWENLLTDRLRANALISYQILSTISLRKRMDISLKNLYVDNGVWRVKQPLPPTPIAVVSFANGDWNDQ